MNIRKNYEIWWADYFEQWSNAPLTKFAALCVLLLPMVIGLLFIPLFSKHRDYSASKGKEEGR